MDSPEAVGAHGIGDGLTAILAAVRRAPGAGSSSRASRPPPDPLPHVLGPDGADAGHGVAAGAEFISELAACQQNPVRGSPSHHGSGSQGEREPGS